MRFNTSISFVSLLVLFFELVAMPFYVNAGVAEKSRSVVSKTETCCARKSAGAPCSKTSDKAKEGPECCVNCPLFQVMMMPQVIMPVKAGLLIERIYPAYEASYLFTYCPSAWKPPNAC